MFRGKLNKDNIKYVGVILDTSLISLTTAALIAKHGGKLLLLDQGSLIGGDNTSFIITDGSQRFLHQNEFYGFARNRFFIQIVEKELNLEKQMRWIKPRIKLAIVGRNNTIDFSNILHIVVASWSNNKFILQKKMIFRFVKDLTDATNQNIYLLSLAQKFKSGADFLADYFAKDSEIYQILAHFCIFNMVSLDAVDAGFFIKSLINFFLSELIFPFAGIAVFFQELLKITIYSKSNLYLNTQYLAARVVNNKMTGLRISVNKQPQWVNSDKYLVATAPHIFFPKVIKKKQGIWQKYQQLLAPHEKQMVKLRFLLTINRRAKLGNPCASKTHAVNIIMNEHDVSFQSSWTKCDPSKRPFFISNFTTLANKVAGESQSINITYYHSLSEWQQIGADKKAATLSAAESIYKIILVRMNNCFPKFSTCVRDYRILFPNKLAPYSDSAKIWNDDGTIQLAGSNNLRRRTADTPIVNCILANHYSNPGGHYMNSFETARNVFYRFDYNVTITNSQKIIATMDINEILAILQHYYCASPRYLDKVIGIHFDNEKTFLLKTRIDRLLIEECTFDEAFSADIYYYSSLVKFKYLIQKKTSLFFSVLFNSIRIKGGVFLLNRVLRATNLNNITQKYIRNNINKIAFCISGYTQTKLLEEELAKVKKKQNATKGTLF